jgi:hypothetical protein
VSKELIAGTAGYTVTSIQFFGKREERKKIKKCDSPKFPATH